MMEAYKFSSELRGCLYEPVQATVPQNHGSSAFDPSSRIDGIAFNAISKPDDEPARLLRSSGPT